MRQLWQPRLACAICARTDVVGRASIRPTGAPCQWYRPMELLYERLTQVGVATVDLVRVTATPWGRTPCMARVLLVEEDLSIREMTALRLQVDGHHVIAVGDADAALDAAAESAVSGPPFDVAVLDVEAPGIDDGALLGILRTHDVTATLPVVFYSGNPGATPVRGLSLADSALAMGHPLTRLLATIASLSPAGADD